MRPPELKTERSSASVTGLHLLWKPSVETRPNHAASAPLVPTPDELVPMRRMQADSISFVGERSGQYGGLLHVIDLFSQYTWAVPVVTVGSTSNTAEAFKKILAQVTERYGADALPEEIDLQTDNGPEFGSGFKQSLPSRVKLRKIPSNTPNKAGDRPVDIAARVCHKPAVDALLKLGAKPASSQAPASPTAAKPRPPLPDDTRLRQPSMSSLGNAEDKAPPSCFCC